MFFLQAAQAARGRTWWVLLIPSVISGFLGVWQVQRLQWKEQLLSERAAALQVYLSRRRTPAPGPCSLYCKCQDYSLYSVDF